MITALSKTTAVAALSLALAAPVSTAWAGAVHNEFAFEVDDYSDCTDETVHWDAVVYETLVDHAGPGGQGVYADNWVFEAVIEGLSSGYAWTTKGISNYHERYSLEHSLTGGWLLVESAVMKPLTEGAPRVKLHANIQMAYNAAGELVVDRGTYFYDCIGD